MLSTLKIMTQPTRLSDATPTWLRLGVRQSMSAQNAILPSPESNSSSWFTVGCSLWQVKHLLPPVNVFVSYARCNPCSRRCNRYQNNHHRVSLRPSEETPLWYISQHPSHFKSSIAAPWDQCVLCWVISPSLAWMKTPIGPRVGPHPWGLVDLNLVIIRHQPSVSVWWVSALTHPWAPLNLPATTLVPSSDSTWTVPGLWLPLCTNLLCLFPPNCLAC